MRDELEGILARHTGRATEEQVRSDIERDKILTADDAVEYGLDRPGHRHPGRHGRPDAFLTCNDGRDGA